MPAAGERLTLLAGEGAAMTVTSRTGECASLLVREAAAKLTSTTGECPGLLAREPADMTVAATAKCAGLLTCEPATAVAPTPATGEHWGETATTAAMAVTASREG